MSNVRAVSGALAAAAAALALSCTPITDDEGVLARDSTKDQGGLTQVLHVAPLSFVRTWPGQPLTADSFKVWMSGNGGMKFSLQLDTAAGWLSYTRGRGPDSLRSNMDTSWVKLAFDVSKIPIAPATYRRKITVSAIGVTAQVVTVEMTVRDTTSPAPAKPSLSTDTVRLFAWAEKSLPDSFRLWGSGASATYAVTAAPGATWFVVTALPPKGDTGQYRVSASANLVSQNRDTTLRSLAIIAVNSRPVDSVNVVAVVLKQPDAAMGYVPAGGASFTMGKDGDAQMKEASPAHTVTFSRGFWMDTTEVTQDLYALLTKQNPSSHSSHVRLPVQDVTWFDAAYFCNRRTVSAGMTDTVYGYRRVIGTAGKGCTFDTVWHNAGARGYRLPTEAEWEFACRAGTTTRFYWGDVADPTYGNTGGSGTNLIQKAGSLKPNGFGLYDMIGNVSEWCGDWMATYSTAPQTDPLNMAAPAASGERVVRGGDWKSAPPSSYDRSSLVPSASGAADLGFRCVLPSAK